MQNIYFTGFAKTIKSLKGYSSMNQNGLFKKRNTGRALRYRRRSCGHMHCRCRGTMRHQCCIDAGAPCSRRQRIIGNTYVGMRRKRLKQQRNGHIGGNCITQHISEPDKELVRMANDTARSGSSRAEHNASVEYDLHRCRNTKRELSSR